MADVFAWQICMRPDDDEIARLLRKPGEIDRLLGVSEDEIRAWSESYSRVLSEVQPSSRLAGSTSDGATENNDHQQAQASTLALKKIGTITLLVISLIAAVQVFRGDRQPRQLKSPVPPVAADVNGDPAVRSTVIRATQDCWMEVRDASRTTLFEGILKQDETLTLSLPEGFEIYPGKPETLLITVDGEAAKLGYELRWYRFPGE